jgi:hypothetical protein
MIADEGLKLDDFMGVYEKGCNVSDGVRECVRCMGEILLTE